MAEWVECPACHERIRVFDVETVKAHVRVHTMQKEMGLPFAPPPKAPDVEQMERETVGDEIPQSLLVRETIGSTFVADEYQMTALQDPGRFDAEVRLRLTRELQAYASDFGFDVQPHSIWFEMVEEVGGAFRGVRITAVWSPDPMAGCEFRGGPVDGERWSLAREVAGRPPRHWVVGTMAPLDFHDVKATDTIPEITLQQARYERAGIDSMRDCWVYEFRSMS